jgi:hypothetical protein
LVGATEIGDTDGDIGEGGVRLGELETDSEKVESVDTVGDPSKPEGNMMLAG